MPCRSCGGGAAATSGTIWQHTTASGVTTPYRSKAEAQTAQSKQGGEIREVTLNGQPVAS